MPNPGQKAGVGDVAGLRYWCIKVSHIAKLSSWLELQSYCLMIKVKQ